MRILIKHLSGQDQGRRRSFRVGTLIIGRDEGCDIRFDLHKDLEVSGRHAEITGDAKGHVEIRDLDSTNGTWVNGEEISCHTLQSGDEIELGSGGPKLRFELRRGLWARLRGVLGDRAAK